jgi:hypothetical protein
MEISPIAHIIKCPHCGGLHTDEVWVERQPVDQFTLWTDGTYICPTTVRVSRPFNLCSYSGCEKTFWIMDAEVVHTVADINPDSPRSDEEQKVYNLWIEVCKGIHYFSVNDCYQAIEEGIAGDSSENWKWLRKFTWQESTEALRTMPDLLFTLGTTFRPSQRHYNNLLELIKLLDVSLKDERILAIEIHRQQGEFKSAADLIEFDWSSDNLELIDYQKELIAKKDMLLRRVPLKEDKSLTRLKR